MPAVKLTKSYADRLMPGPRDAIHWDSECHGLHLKVTPAGKKVFLVYYRTKGASSLQRRYKLGDYGALTVQQARERARGVLNAVSQGQDPALERARDRQRLNHDRVDGLVAEFIEKHAVRTRSAAETERIFERDVLPRFGSRSVHTVTKRDIVSMLDAIADRGSPIMANRTLAATRKFFNWCLARDVLQKSPCDRVGAPGRETKRDRLLTDDELRRVLATAREIGFPYSSIVQLLGITGQRREEVAGMRWAELDLPARTWTIPAVRSKNGKPHIVHLSDVAVDVVAGLPRVADLVFTTNGRTPFQGWSKAKRDLDQRAAISGWTLHDLRRTVVSGMARLGIPPHIADKVLNHQSGTISGVAAVYQRHQFLAERRDALDHWGDHVVNLLAGHQVVSGAEVIPFDARAKQTA